AEAFQARDYRHVVRDFGGRYGDQYDWFVNPNPGYPTPPAPLPQAHADLPGYAVYVDPIGVAAYSVNLNSQRWVGSVPGVPRCFIDFVPQAPALQRTQATIYWFTFLDDMTFLRDGGYEGLPCPPPPAAAVGFGQIQRDGRYSWGFLLRRPRSS